MVKLKNVSYNELIMVDRYYYNGVNQMLYFTKKATSGADQYFLELFILEDGVLKQQGYLYFFVNFVENESKFVGAYINPLYRNKGLASLLIANWIKLCFDNDIVNLKTHKKQKKPLLLYLLKCSTFEIQNLSDHDSLDSTISICRGVDGVCRLLFKDENKRRSFLESAIRYDGNYEVLDELGIGDLVVDRVLPNRTYYVGDETEAYGLASKCIAKRERKNN